MQRRLTDTKVLILYYRQRKREDDDIFIKITDEGKIIKKSMLKRQKEVFQFFHVLTFNYIKNIYMYIYIHMYKNITNS